MRNATRSRPDPIEAADEWNKVHPPGTPVTVLKDEGDTVQTTTRSRAEVLSGHTAVIWLDGISGCYALERVAFDISRVARTEG